MQEMHGSEFHRTFSTRNEMEKTHLGIVFAIRPIPSISLNDILMRSNHKVSEEYCP